MIVDELQQAMDTLRVDGLQRQRRTLHTPCGPLAEVDRQQLISFCSNDYLGLANDPALIEAACAGARCWGVGSGASHLVSGHLEPHAALEDQLAEFSGFARALLFSTGYLANLGIIPTLVGRGDAVFADRLNHASLIDAVQLSRADSQRYAHGDVESLERLLSASTAKRKLDEVLTTGAAAVVTACPSCVRSLTMAKNANKTPVAVADITQLVFEAMVKTGGTHE